MVLAKMNRWTLTEFIARLETGFVEAKVMPIGKIYGLFSGIVSDTKLEKPSMAGLVTHIKENYEASSHTEIVTVLSQTLTLYLEELFSEQGHQMQQNDQFDLSEDELKRLRALISASLIKRGLDRSQASRAFEISPVVFPLFLTKQLEEPL